MTGGRRSCFQQEETELIEEAELHRLRGAFSDTADLQEARALLEQSHNV